MREGEQHALRLEAVGLVEALADHPAVRVEIAVRAGHELPEAVEVLPRRVQVVRVAEVPGEPHRLGQRDEPERVQVLVGGGRLVAASGAEAVAAEQGVRTERHVVAVAEGERPVGGAAGHVEPAHAVEAAGGVRLVQQGVGDDGVVAVLRGRRQGHVLGRAAQELTLDVRHIGRAGAPGHGECPGVVERGGGLGERRDPGEPGGAEVGQRRAGVAVVGGGEPTRGGVLAGPGDGEVGPDGVLPVGMVVAAGAFGDEGAQQEQGGVAEGAGVQPVRVGRPACVPAGAGAPLAPEGAGRGEAAGDMVQHGDRVPHQVRVVDPPGVQQHRVRVGRAADPGDVHGLPVAACAERLAVERRGLQQHRRVGAEVPAVQPVCGEFGGVRDRHPGGRFGRGGGGAVQRPQHRGVGVRVGVQQVQREAEGVLLAWCPGVEGCLRRQRGVRAVVADGLLAVGGVQPQRRPGAVQQREADALLAEFALLGQRQGGAAAAVAGEHGRRRTAVGAERPGVGRQIVEIRMADRARRVRNGTRAQAGARGGVRAGAQAGDHVRVRIERRVGRARSGCHARARAGYETRVAAGAFGQPVGAVEHAGDQPAGVVRVRAEPQFDAQPHARRARRLAAHGEPGGPPAVPASRAIEAQPGREAVRGAGRLQGAVRTPDDPLGGHRQAAAALGEQPDQIGQRGLARGRIAQRHGAGRPGLFPGPGGRDRISDRPGHPAPRLVPRWARGPAPTGPSRRPAVRGRPGPGRS